MFSAFKKFFVGINLGIGLVYQYSITLKLHKVAKETIMQEVCLTLHFCIAFISFKPLLLMLSLFFLT